jgi:hypothetical protein
MAASVLVCSTISMDPAYDPAPAALAAVGVTAAVLALAAAIATRHRARRSSGTVLGIFWQDASAIALVVSALLGIPAAAALAAVEGLGSWTSVLVGLAQAGAAVGLLVHRWRTQELRRAGRSHPAPTAAPRPLLVSTGWEVGIGTAGVVGLGTYVLSQDHGYPHAAHWGIAGLGLLAGYALALAIVTPRFTVRPEGSEPGRLAPRRSRRGR